MSRLNGASSTQPQAAPSPWSQSQQMSFFCFVLSCMRCSGLTSCRSWGGSARVKHTAASQTCMLDRCLLYRTGVNVNPSILLCCAAPHCFVSCAGHGAAAQPAPRAGQHHGGPAGGGGLKVCAAPTGAAAGGGDGAAAQVRPQAVRRCDWQCRRTCSFIVRVSIALLLSVVGVVVCPAYWSGCWQW